MAKSLGKCLLSTKIKKYKESHKFNIVDDFLRQITKIDKGGFFRGWKIIGGGDSSIWTDFYSIIPSLNFPKLN